MIWYGIRSDVLIKVVDTINTMREMFVMVLLSSVLHGCEYL